MISKCARFAETIVGSRVSKARFVLVVNVASACGLTPQYDGLQRLYDEYRGQGLEVLGFPCNQFGGQEPGDDAEIAEFCEGNFGVQFPMFSKVDVNGDRQDPLFGWLTSEQLGPDGPGEIAWNFGKFLIGRDGVPVARFSPQAEPCSEAVKVEIEKALNRSIEGTS